MIVWNSYVTDKTFEIDFDFNERELRGTMRAVGTHEYDSLEGERIVHICKVYILDEDGDDIAEFDCNLGQSAVIEDEVRNIIRGDA